MKALISGVICLFALSTAITAAEHVVYEDYEKMDGLLRIGPEPERQIWLTERGYTLIVPEDRDKLTGIVVFFQRGRIPADTTEPEPGSFDAAALNRGVGIMHVASGNPLDFFFSEDTMGWVAERIETALTEHDARGVPVFFAGLSLGGTRAAKLAQYLFEHRINYWLYPSAIALVDSPLDMERMYWSEMNAADNNFHPAAADEGRWVSYLLRTNLGGDPDTVYDAYVAYSPYTHTAEDGGNAAALRTLPVRAYHEPDVNWWIENRRKSYYDTNSIDLAALVNELKLMGNQHAELVTSHQQREGYDEGSSPHTWSFVENDTLVEWFLAMAGE